MSLAFDEYGRPFIIIRVRLRPALSTHACTLSGPAMLPGLQEQASKSRIKGIDAVKASIHAAKSVARILRSSLGPKGMDKMLQSPDGDVTISACRSCWRLRAASTPCLCAAQRAPTLCAAHTLPSPCCRGMHAQPMTGPPSWR